MWVNQPAASIAVTVASAAAIAASRPAFRNGKLTLRHKSRLHHIGIGRRHDGTTVPVLVHDLHVRVLSTSGEMLRDLRLDLSRDYQPQART